MRSSDSILRELGTRARALRLRRGWTLRELSERSGMSSRFLAELEAGRGNISVRRLVDIARALDTTAEALLAEPSAPAKSIVALMGLRGAGKTTVGRRLAKRLRLPFVELDRRIEEAAELSLGEIFSLHGEGHYRRLEREAVEHVIAESKPMVLATGGGLVTAAETLALLRRAAVTVWLRATPEEHWNRVVQQGDRRPMADHPQAMADLRTLLTAREPLYSSAADFIVDTSGRRVDQVLAEMERIAVKPTIV